MKRNWLIGDAADDEAIKLYDFCGINKIIGSILYARGTREKKDVISFLFPELNHLHSPFLMKGIPEAVKRIRKALAAAERIAIFADSDLDGITSLTILYDLLSKCGSTPHIRYPMNKEGYGLTCDIIDEFISADINLLITVDSGIRDVEEIRYAADKGIETIVTDHHEPDSICPDAIIINPKMQDCPYPFKELAGVGVAFKLAHALLFSYTGSYNRRFVLLNSSDNRILFHFILNGVLTESGEVSDNDLHRFFKSRITDEDHLIFTDSVAECLSALIIKNNLKNSYNTLLGISNIITGMDYKNQREMLNSLLQKYNIVKTIYRPDDLIVKLFLELQMRSSRKAIERMQVYIALAAVGTIADIMPLYGENRNIIKYGLDVIKHGKGHGGIQALINNPDPTAKNITWDVAPLLNAPGRLGETGLTVDFFLSEDAESISGIIREIEKLNRERKKIVVSVTEHIKNRIAEDPDSANRKIYFYMGNEIMSGLAGLIASRIADELKKPVIIAVEEPGSEMVKGSGRSYNDFNFFRFVEPLSEMFERIGGHAQAFGFTAKKDKMEQIINSINDAIDGSYEYDENIRIDTLINIDEITTSLIDKISLLEPFGKNNEEPVFAAKGVAIDSFSKFGSNENHGRYVLKNGLHVIGWNMTEKMESYIKKDTTVDMVFNLENNVFMNRKFPRLRLIDIDFS